MINIMYLYTQHAYSPTNKKKTYELKNLQRLIEAR